MSKVKLTEEDLRKVINAALLEAPGAPAAPSDLGGIHINTFISDLVKASSNFNPEVRLKFLGSLKGAETARPWFDSIATSCTVNNLMNVVGWSAPGKTQYNTNPGAFLNDFLNFVIIQVMSGKIVLIPSLSNRNNPDDKLKIGAVKLYDIIALDDVTYVYPGSPALIASCKTYLGEGRVTTFADPSFISIIADDAKLTDIMAGKLSPDSKLRDEDQPAANTCYSYVSDQAKQSAAAKVEEEINEIVRQMQPALDYTSQEVFESYLYMPLLAPRVWKTPELSPGSPLYTPWRMTWAACNLMSDILTKHGNLGKAAVLTQIYKIINRGTSLNVFDAPGEDFALGAAIREARFQVGSIMLTEHDLRRVINAALTAKIGNKKLNEGNWFTNLFGMPDPTDVARAARAVGSAVGGAADAAGAALRAEGEAVEAAAGSLDSFVGSVRAGEKFLEDSGFLRRLGLADVYNDIIKPQLGRTYMSSIQKNILANLANKLIDASGNPKTAIRDAIVEELRRRIVVSQKIISQDDAQNLASAYMCLLSMTASRAAALDANVDDLRRYFTGFSSAISPEGKRLLHAADQDALTLSFASVSDDIINLTRADADAAVADMIGKSTALLSNGVGRTIRSAARSLIAIEFDPASQSILIKVPQATFSGPINNQVATLGTFADVEFTAYYNALTAAKKRAYETALNAAGLPPIQDLNKAAKSLAAPEAYNTAINTTLGALTTASANSLKVTTASSDVAGVLPGTKSKGLLSTLSDAWESPGRFSPVSSSGGIIPGVPLPFLKDPSGRQIESAAATRAAWNFFQANRASRNYGRAALGFATSFAALTYDAATMVTRAKSYAGTKVLQGVASLASKSSSSWVKGAGTALGKTLRNRPTTAAYLGLGTAWLISSSVESLASWATGGTTTKKVGESGKNVLRTMYVDLNKPPISISGSGVSLLAGGPLRVLGDIVVAAWDARFNAASSEDLVLMLKILQGEGDPKSPAAVIDDALSSGFSNLFKNAVSKDEASDILIYFPELSEGFVEAALPEGFVAWMQSLTAGWDTDTEEVVRALEAGDMKRAQEASADALAEAQENIRIAQAMAEEYKNAKESLGVSFAGTASALDKLETNRAACIAAVNKALKQANSTGFITEIQQYRNSLVVDNYGRGSDTGYELDIIDSLSAVFFDAESFFDLTTDFYEFAGADVSDNGTALAAALKKNQGTYGIEFSGDLSDPYTEQVLDTLASSWSASAESVGILLNAITGISESRSKSGAGEQ